MSIKSNEGPLKKLENFFEASIFWSRWVQAPMYGGLVLASFIYVFKFFQELFHLWYKAPGLSEAKVMLYVLGLVDISMVINLLVMVVIGGYSIFTSKIDVDQHEDKPLWLEELDAGRLKIKLAASLASISGVHLLKTFIDIRGAQEFEGVTGISIEILIHLTFIISALLLAWTEKVQHSYHSHESTHDSPSNGHHPKAEEPSSPQPAPTLADIQMARRAAIAAVQARKRVEAALAALQQPQAESLPSTPPPAYTDPPPAFLPPEKKHEEPTTPSSPEQATDDHNNEAPNNNSHQDDRSKDKDDKDKDGNLPPPDPSFPPLS